MRLNQTSEPKVLYRKISTRYRTHVWNTRVFYADKKIILPGNIIKGAFRRAKYQINPGDKFQQ